MYHFIFKVSKKVFPNAFDITHKVNQEKEQIIDFCPKCNEKLEDKRIITLRRHDQKNHPKTEKELVKRFYSRGSMPMFLMLGCVAILTIILFGGISISSQIEEEALTEDETEYVEFCKNLIGEMPQYGAIWEFKERDPITIERGEYVLEHLTDFEKCYYSASFISLGDKSDRLEYYNSFDGE